MRHITRCLNTRLAGICQHAIKLEELDEKVRKYLPEEIREHCYVGSFTNSCLLLVTTDPAWASQLRYALPELRDKLRKEAGIHQLASIRITVNMEHGRVLPEPAAVSPKLSEKAREGLESLRELFNKTS